MIYLNLQKNKVLKANQSATIYEGENLADEIKITIAEEYADKECYLVILASTENAGDTVLIKNGDSYWLDHRYLTTSQDLIAWIEVRNLDQIIKSSEVVLRVDKHHKIEQIITDADITLFEQILAETKQIQKNLEEKIEEVRSPEVVTNDTILQLFTNLKGGS